VGQRMIRPGLQVIRLGFRGKGQIVGIDSDGLCEVLWQRGAQRHPECDLVWCGLTVHTCDGRPGKVVALGYNKVRVRLSNGTRCWMSADEFARPQSNQDVVAEP